jgi:hypothetical protein
MVQTLHTDTRTTSVGTRDWLKASEGMIISAFVETEMIRSKKEDQLTEEKMFGTHLRELKEDLKNLLKR